MCICTSKTTQKSSRCKLKQKAKQSEVLSQDGGAAPLSTGKTMSLGSAGLWHRGVGYLVSWTQIAGVSKTSWSSRRELPQPACALCALCPFKLGSWKGGSFNMRVSGQAEERQVMRKHL